MRCGEGDLCLCLVQKMADYYFRVSLRRKNYGVFNSNQKLLLFYVFSSGLARETREGRIFSDLHRV